MGTNRKAVYISPIYKKGEKNVTVGREFLKLSAY